MSKIDNGGNNEHALPTNNAIVVMSPPVEAKVHDRIVGDYEAHNKIFLIHEKIGKCDKIGCNIEIAPIFVISDKDGKMISCHDKNAGGVLNKERVNANRRYKYALKNHYQAHHTVLPEITKLCEGKAKAVEFLEKKIAYVKERVDAFTAANNNNDHNIIGSDSKGIFQPAVRRKRRAPQNEE